MKTFCTPMILLLMFTATLWGAGPGEEYVRVYSLIQQGETLERAHQGPEALAAFMDAQQALVRLKKANPSWNPKVVDYRLNFLQARIARLSPSAVEPPASQPGTPAAAPSQEAPVIVRPDAEMEQMNQELEQLRAANTALQAKLKEALSVRPAAAEPGALEKAEAKGLALTKEIELLKSKLEEAQAKTTVAPDSKASKEAQTALEQQTRRADQLAAERAALASQVSALKASEVTVATLRDENALLKQQLQEQRSQIRPADNQDTQRRLDQLIVEFALLRSEADILRLEKTALEQRMQVLKDRSTSPVSTVAPVSSDDKKRIAKLEGEVSQLQLQLAQANQALASRSAASVGEPNGLTQAEIDRLKARLSVYEAERQPYSVEELALFRMSKVMSADDASRPRPPSGVASLVGQAERQFKQGQFQLAETTLKEILGKDETNAFTLSNLGATQIELGRDAEAEANLRRALAGAPQDPFTLATLGILKFRQKQYDEALDYLGLAAQYDPKNAVIHNYLGMTLSEKGMRGPAETALRRAIQLQPGFGDAQFNLALVYILQEPPLPELARWHYQKALEVGHERSTEMEQLLDRRGVN